MIERARRTRSNHTNIRFIQLLEQRGREEQKADDVGDGDGVAEGAGHADDVYEPWDDAAEVVLDDELVEQLDRAVEVQPPQEILEAISDRAAAMHESWTEAPIPNKTKETI